MKGYIKLFLFTVDVVTAVKALVQFFYYEDYTFSVIISIICLILSLYLYIDNKENKIYYFVKDYFCFLKELNENCKRFKTSCIIYICLNILICFLGSILGNIILMLLYWIFFPIVFSIYTIIFSSVNKPNIQKIIKLYVTTLYFPSLFIMIGGIFSVSRFIDFIMIIFGGPILYLPSYIMTKFTIKRIDRE